MLSQRRSRIRLRFEVLEPRTLLTGSALVAATATIPFDSIATATPPLLGLASPGGSGAPPGGALTPEQIRAAYGIDQLSQDGAGQTIAIVDAYDDPGLVSSSNAAAYATSDLHNFRRVLWTARFRHARRPNVY